MEGMILSFRVGMVEVKARKFQQLCQTYPQCIINELDVQLPRIATTKCDLLSDEIKVCMHGFILEYLLLYMEGNCMCVCLYDSCCDMTMTCM